MSLAKSGQRHGIHYKSTCFVKYESCWHKPASKSVNIVLQWPEFTEVGCLLNILIR